MFRVLVFGTSFPSPLLDFSSLLEITFVTSSKFSFLLLLSHDFASKSPPLHVTNQDFPQIYQDLYLKCFPQ